MKNNYVLRYEKKVYNKETKTLETKTLTTTIAKEVLIRNNYNYKVIAKKLKIKNYTLINANRTNNHDN